MRFMSFHTVPWMMLLHDRYRYPKSAFVKFTRLLRTTVVTLLLLPSRSYVLVTPAPVIVLVRTMIV